MAKSKIAIIGLGRLGGSIGLALKRAKLDVEIVGHDKETAVAGAAQKRGAVDKTEWNLINACTGAGMVILALPVQAIAPTLSAMSKYLEPGQIITDTAATKVPVMQAARLLPTSVQFIGGDPVLAAVKRGKDAKGQPLPPAPTPVSAAVGIEAADADLFQNALYCLIPGESVSEAALQTVSGLVTILGARPLFIDAEEHDSLTAGVRQLPVALAAALLQANVDSPSWRDMSKLAGADLYRATEPLASDAAGLAQSLLANRDALTHWIDASLEALEGIRAAIAHNDAEALTKLLDRLGDRRALWLSGEAEQSTGVNMDDIRASTMRIFLGGLARERKRP